MTPGRRATLLGLHVLLGIYALSDVFSKYAAGAGFPDIAFFLFYGLMLVFLGVYALGWQQVIKRMPLSSAFANRAVTVVWGIFWGAVLFGEDITFGKLAGVAIIMAGIILYARADTTDSGDDGGKSPAPPRSSKNDTSKPNGTSHEKRSDVA